MCLIYLNVVLTGIKYGVDKNFKDVTCFQILCARHMYQHINHGFTKPKLQSAVFKAAKAYNEDEHDYALYMLDLHKRRWIEAGGQKSWARHSYDPSSSYRQMTNIISKAFNQWITKLKCKPICQWVMGFESKLIHLFSRRKRNGSLWKDKHLVPRASKNACDCDEWKISGIPCVHAMVILAEITPPRYKHYVHECYTIERYRASYVGNFNQMVSMTEWPQETRTILNP
ncbi:hypothetical protein MKX01_040631 [Papaver californicum]|nr:hypothetical protein MKX01_040631 [Papaver californicum]